MAHVLFCFGFRQKLYQMINQEPGAMNITPMIMIMPKWTLKVILKYTILSANLDQGREIIYFY